MYLKGFIEVLKFVKKNDVDALYIGKIGIKDLTLLKEVEGVHKPKYLLTTLLEKRYIEPSERRIDEEILQRILQL